MRGNGRGEADTDYAAQGEQAVSFLVGWWIYGWMAWHARVRLKLEETPRVEE